MVSRVLALVGCLLLLAGPAAAAEAWTPYSNAEFGVSTSMPGAPKVKVESNPAGADQTASTTMTAVVVTDGGVAYVLRVDSFAGNLNAPPMQVLNHTVDVVSTPERGPVYSRVETTAGGYPAIDVVFGPDKDGDYLRDRLIAKDHQLIQLITGRSGAPPDLDRFYGDLRIAP